MKWNFNGANSVERAYCWRPVFVLPVTLGLWQWASHIISLHLSFICNGELPCLSNSKAYKGIHSVCILWYLHCSAQCQIHSGCSTNVLIGSISDYVHLKYDVDGLKNEAVWELTNLVEDKPHPPQIVAIICKNSALTILELYYLSLVVLQVRYGFLQL